jgi:hypothetical protein
MLLRQVQRNSGGKKKAGATSRFKSLLCYESNPDLKSRKISVSTGVGHTRR